MRKLASIKVISDIQPIKGKDRIGLATVDGWTVIVEKALYNVGDKCVYVEIDSIMPAREEFAFLSKNNYRIKTMKMAGVISQGICFPLSILPEKKIGEYKVDEDVTEILGVTQYERTMDTGMPISERTYKKPKYPNFLMRMKWFRKLTQKKHVNRNFPSFVKKTDETRIQNMPFILKNKEKWVVTEKLDGQSGTFCLVRHKSGFLFEKEKLEYMVCSRNLWLEFKDSSSYWRVSDRYQIPEVLKNLIGDKDWVALQGECIAPDVQGNKYKVKEADFYAFNLIYPEGRLDSETAKAICEKNGLQFVPILDTEYTLPDTVNEMLEYAHGQSAIGDTLREGVVLRSKDGQQSFKAVDPLFLLKYDE